MRAFRQVREELDKLIQVIPGAKSKIIRGQTTNYIRIKEQNYQAGSTAH